MQIHVDDIEPHVAGADLAENRVEVRAVVIEQAAGLVHDARHLRDLVLEHAEGRGIGEHDARRARSDRGLELGEIDVAVLVAGNLPHIAAAHRRSGRIRAVRRLRHDDIRARGVAAGAVIGADHRHAGEFALGARHGGEAHALHAGDLLEHLLQLVHAREEALRLGRERMAREELRQHRIGVARLGVVLHGARAQRIEMRVDGEVELRQAREMAHHLQFRHFGQCRCTGSAQVRRYIRRPPRSRIGGRRDLTRGAPARLAQLEYQRLAKVEFCHAGSRSGGAAHIVRHGEHGT